MAVVTLISFANGSGDIITSFVASSSPGGISYNIGILYGGGIFVCSLVIAFTILKNKTGIPITMTNRIIYRDIGLYILATTVIILIGYSGKIYWWSLLVFSIYKAIDFTIIIYRNGNNCIYTGYDG